MPLAELQLDKLSLPAEQPEAAMEIDPGSTHHDDNATQPRSSQPDHSQPLRSVITAPAPLGTPLADIINSINYGTSPSISICPPDDDIVFEPEYESPLPRNSHPSTSEDSHLSPDSSLTSFRAAGTLRRTITSSANDPRRISCDLQSSFSLVMQSSEMSFDLLNDKISFFGQGQQQESSWPGEHEDDILDFSNNDKVAPMGDEGMMKAEDVSMEDDTFDFAKEKKMMDALGEKYGSIHEERLRPVERAAEAAVANSPKQRGISEVPLPRFTLSPRPSPLKEELIAAKNESELEEELVEPMHIPNIFAQSLSESAGNENQEPIDSEPSRVVKPRRSSIATPGALSRRLSIPALAIFKKAEEPKHKRTVSSASTASSIDTTSRASLARRGSLSSSKASADNTRSTSTATTSLARRGSLSTEWHGIREARTRTNHFIRDDCKLCGQHISLYSQS
ncbi:hypothetical protein BDY19DRAFT_667501 [Irpex rosettiformis]|uniref:Uncharacterized protein n=1 Tax=Irpex rosettiformis TaxID=378272 RepID=A0ACB8UA29_9APHY|nr:hypothetical protein BDY19DRAFT_667501 [Irpex rosettiformis]